MATEKEFPVGALLENRYRILNVIGTGGMGTLYRVSDEARDGEIVALKIVHLRGSAAEAAESVARFQREFQLLTQLRHPNLVSVYDYGVTTAGELYFTMEWVEGGDLEPGKRFLKPEATIGVMVQVCRALAYLHARGVIHGDLKPANVLLTGDWVKLVDFGVAYEVRSPEDRARYYTPGYAAPETRQPQPIDQRSDLYSLGAMWYTLLVGQPPMFMPGPGRERLIRFALDEALEAQSQIPAAMGAVIARLMATSPDDRYDSADEVIEAVNEIMGSAYELETRETAASYALRTHFVNREAEIEVLQTVWKKAQTDEGKLVLISGESGVGKTRLVTELEVQAELEGARVIWGQCLESGGSAYHPWREVLRVLVRYVEAGGETAMQRAGPVLATVLPELWGREYMSALEPPADLTPQAAQQRLNDAILQVLQTAAGLRPTVVVIENAHWADEATLELLRFLARIPGCVGLLICVTYRDDEVEADHVLETLAGAVSRSDHRHYGEQVQRIRVGRLSPEVTTELVRSMLGLEQLPGLLIERVQQTTGGNAFFVQEMIRSLAAEGEVLRRTVDGWQINRDVLEETRLPEGIQQTVLRRLNQLSEEGQRVLNWAAVVGMVFWEGGVAEAGQVPWQRVRIALREGLEQELVVVRDETSLAGEREYLFLNPTVWEVSYDSIPQEERRDYHGRVAAWLMARSDGEASERLGLIAEHLERAGQIEQAVDYLHWAGELAAAQFANTEAIDYLSRAIDLMPEKDWNRWYDILLIREKIYSLQGARSDQDQDLTALEELAEVLDDEHRRIEVALHRIGYAEAIGDYPAAIVSARQAVALAQAAGDVESEARAYFEWGRVIWRQGDYVAARPSLEQGLALARSAGLPQVEAGSLRILGEAAFMSREGNFTEGKGYLEQSLRICREIGDRQGEGETLNLLGSLHTAEGDYDEARVCLEQTLHIAQEIGDRRFEGFAIGNLGRLLGDQGDYTQAREHYEKTLHILRETGDRLYEGFTFAMLGALCRDQGDYTQAQAHLEQTLAIEREVGSLIIRVRGLSELSILYRDQGDYRAALEYAQQAVQAVRQSDALLFQAMAWVALGNALEGLERLEEAADAYQQILAMRSELSLYDLIVDSLAGLTRVLLAQDDLAQAQTHVEAILSRLETKPLNRMREPFRVGLTCYRVLHANGEPRAEDILRTVYDLLQERAANIADEDLRRLFLENVPAHREIVSEWASLPREEPRGQRISE